jgi:NhaP-type Na+/H+ or K+/H+ antiporter
LLPAIIFEAGYTLEKEDFFYNIGSVTLFAFIGTVISTIVVALGIYLLTFTGIFKLEITLIDCLLFGSLISAVDPVATLAIFNALKVNPTLHYLVFGESVVNDAVAITLFTYVFTFFSYISFHSLLTDYNFSIGHLSHSRMQHHLTLLSKLY